MKVFRNKVIYIPIALILISILGVHMIHLKKINIKNEAIFSTLEKDSEVNIIYDNDKPLKNCDFIKRRHTIKVNYTLYQKAEEENNYVLLIFADDKQQDFYVNGQQYRQYYFNLAESSYADLDIKLKLQETDTQNIIFVTYKEPEYLFPTLEEAKERGSVFTEGDKWKALSTKHTYITRLFFEDTPFHDISVKSYSDYLRIPNAIIRKETGDGTPFGSANEKFDFIFFTEENEIKIYYKAVYLLNFEQVEKAENPKQVIVNPGESFIKSGLTLPEAEETSSFEFLLIPYPELAGYIGKAIDMSVRPSSRITIRK